MSDQVMQDEPGTAGKIHFTKEFTKEKETMLMTLSGRAIQSGWKRPILRDPWAEEVMRQIDYNIGERYGKGRWRLVADLGCTVIATRAATFDLLTKRFLDDHPEATVLHVGCGMDSRAFRVNPADTVQWFDVDYPDVIELRRQLLPERGPSYHLIGAPLEDLHWLEALPRDQPALLIAEGVMHYLSEAEVKALLNAVVAHFPSGQVIFDAGNSWVVKRTGENVGGTGATYRWGLDDPQDVKQLEPRLELVKELKPSELVAFDRFAWWMRGLFRAMELNAALRRMERVVVYRY